MGWGFEHTNTLEGDYLQVLVSTNPYPIAQGAKSLSVLMDQKYLSEAYQKLSDTR
jgi:hypothetical protein